MKLSSGRLSIFCSGLAAVSSAAAALGASLTVSVAGSRETRSDDARPSIGLIVAGNRAYPRFVGAFR